MDFEGTLVLEKLAAIGCVDDFFEAIDDDAILAMMATCALEGGIVAGKPPQHGLARTAREPRWKWCRTTHCAAERARDVGRLHEAPAGRATREHVQEWPPRSDFV